MKKIVNLIVSAMIAMSLMITVMPIASAQGTILPKADSGAGGYDCQKLLDEFNSSGKFMIPSDGDKTLGCAINTGKISLAMIPYFIQYFSNYLLGMVSLVALLFVVLGGFLYGLGGLTEQKDKGKTYIRNAITGMVIAFLAWSIVNVILAAVTG